MSRLLLPFRSAAAANGDAYRNKILSYNPGALWTFEDTEGLDIVCSVDPLSNGTYPGAGVTLANELGPNGITPVATWTGGVGDLQSANFINNVYLSGAPVTTLWWVKPNAAALWTDGVNRYVFRWYSGGNDQWIVRKTTGDDMIIWHLWAGISFQGTKDMSGIAPADWTCWATKFDRTNDYHRYWYQGVAFGAEAARDTGYNKNYSEMAVAGWSGAPAEDWLGAIAYVAFWNEEVPDADIVEMSVMV